jgi:hypothetical protein
MPQHYYQGTVGNKRETESDGEKKKEERKINEGEEEKKTILFSFVRSFSLSLFIRFNIF